MQAFLQLAQAAAPAQNAEHRTQNAPKGVHTKRASKSRVPFSASEDRALREGITACGKGRWQAILERGQAAFRRNGRTAVNLKDRARTLRL